MSIKRALLVGIDNYVSSKLPGCVKDVEELNGLLSTNDDLYPNFDKKLILAPLKKSAVVRDENGQSTEHEKIDSDLLLSYVKELFSHRADLALFYFSGHGYINEFGGFLVSQNGKSYDSGIRMRDIMTAVERAKKKNLIQEIVIVLDCCHSGLFGSISETEPEIARIPDGVTIIAACEHYEHAVGDSRGGVLTKGIRNALNGGGADPLGDITAISIYNYLTGQLSNAWNSQNLVFKTNMTSKYKVIKKCAPDFQFSILNLVPEIFEEIDFELALEPNMIEINANKDYVLNDTAKRLLQLIRLGVIEIIGEEDIIYAIKDSCICKLTPLGRYYWRVLKLGK